MNDLKSLLNEKLQDKEFKKGYHRTTTLFKLADELLMLRKKRGLSQKELAEKVGTTQAVVSLLENASVKASLESVVKFAEALDAIGIHINKPNHLAEIGYWIGKQYWNQGYCTEAAKEVIKYAFDVFNLNRIHSRHMTKNPASGRVMQKVGMEYEGTLRQSLFRWDKYEDAAIYSILREEYIASAIYL